MGRDQTPSDRKFIGSFLSPQARTTLKKFNINADEMLNLGAAQPTQPQATGDSVEVISPEGQRGTVPRDKVQAAIQRGFKVVGK